MYGKKPPTEKETFEKKPKSSKSSVPKRPSKKEEAEGLYEETEGKIKEGGLRKNLKVDKDYKFTKTALAKLLKNEVGKKFTFQDKSFMMTEKLRKQIQLGLNMIKN